MPALRGTAGPEPCLHVPSVTGLAPRRRPGGSRAMPTFTFCAVPAWLACGTAGADLPALGIDLRSGTSGLQRFRGVVSDSRVIPKNASTCCKSAVVSPCHHPATHRHPSLPSHRPAAPSPHAASDPSHAWFSIGSRFASSPDATCHRHAW